MKKGLPFIIIFLLLFTISISAFEFNGTVTDPNGNLLENVNISVSIRDETWSEISTNTTLTDSNGYFNLTLPDNETYFYQPSIFYYNSTLNYVQYVGQSIPSFPYFEFSELTEVPFQLYEAGTINITAINETNDRIQFNYQIKDTKLGYSIAEAWETSSYGAIAYLPKNRNYSIMIYPDQSMPVSFNWNNFSSSSSYNLNSISSYNATTKTLHKQFNTTMSLARVTGYIDYTNITGWEEFTVIPFLLEPGNMIYMGSDGGMPYNMSSWQEQSDIYNLSQGYYNISLPATTEQSTMILLATSKNQTWFGAYKNISLSYGSSGEELNFSLYHLLGSSSNFTMHDARDWSDINISTAQQTFNLINSSGQPLDSQTHIELRVDYSDYGGQEITFMTDTSENNPTFTLPLLNVTGIKEMNVFSQMYAPKRLTRTVSQIQTNNNITLSSFDPQSIGDTVAESNIQVYLFRSNSTCDVPNPSASCNVVDSSNMENFNPLSAVIGGGSLSFRMGMPSSGILIHYVNVDMLASGPPDALFDDEADETTSNEDFSSALRFGSQGPTIYEYVLVSMPYSTSEGSGLNESAEVNMSIPLFYDDDWNVIWDTSSNGTSASSLAGNYSHYQEHQSEWAILMNQTTCTTTLSEFNLTNPCYLDTSNNRIWIRIPHFSGTGASITGTVLEDDDSGSSSSSSSGGSTSSPTPTPTATPFKYTTPTPFKSKTSLSGIELGSISFNENILSTDLKITTSSSENANVVVKYIIKDEQGNVISEVQETKKVKKELALDKDLDLDLDSGNYTLLIKVLYNGRELTAEDNFTVIKQEPLDSQPKTTIKIPFQFRLPEFAIKTWIIMGGITAAIVVVLITLLVLKRPKKRKIKFNF